MSKPWGLLIAGAVGGTALLAWALTPKGQTLTPAKRAPKQKPRQPKVQIVPKETPFSPQDIEAAARMLSSENPRGSEQLHVEQIWTQLRSRKKGQSLYERITAGSGFGPQGERRRPGHVRPVATSEPATDAFRNLAHRVLRGEIPSKLPGAKKFFEPEVADKAFKIGQEARRKLAAGEPLTKQELRLRYYKKPAQAIRDDWLKTSKYLETIDKVEFFT